MKLKRLQYVVLNGNLVYGKQWLAIDACCNYTIMQQMGFNVFFLNLSNCETKEDIYDQFLLYVIFVY